jgi:hypothetical protein
MITGNFFVTDYAARKFQELFAPYHDLEEIRDIIIKGLDGVDQSDLRPTENGKAWYVRVTTDDYKFRAVIGPGKGEKLAVITVLRSGHSKKSKYEYNKRKKKQNEV